MLGAVAGDIIGSVYEYQQIKSEEFPLFGPESRFTDDTVMTVAVAHAILEDAVRKAVSLGGDSDTLACIAGGIAEAFYGEVPPHIADTARRLLPGEFLAIIDRFRRIYPG
jgi:ADP-ribosylglycohydrolase